MQRNLNLKKIVKFLSSLFIILLTVYWGILFIGLAQSESYLINPCVAYQHFIPITFDDYYGLLEESGNNNTVGSANGPIIRQVWYRGKPDDDFDFFKFQTVVTGNIQITITNHSVNGGQAVLYSDTNYPHYLAIETSPPNYTLETLNAPPDTYFILVFVDVTKPYTPTQYYNVIAEYALPTVSNITPSPIPTCTPTLTPSLTSTMTSSATPVTLCEFEPISAGFSVLFPTGTAGHIRADDGARAMTTAVSLTPIAPGFYQVTMYSYDDHTAKPDQNQPDEIWYLHLKNASGTVIATAGPSTDIPDGAGNDCQPTYLENMLVLTDTAVSAEAYHAAYPDPHKNPNSVNPDYALLIPVRMVAPPPTHTPLPPHLATRTPTP